MMTHIYKFVRLLFIFVCLIIKIDIINAQSCVLSYNNSSSNPITTGNFNWLSPSFPMRWTDNNININPITSPFFQSNNAGLNYIVFGQNYSYNDGWELLQKNVSLGNVNGEAISHPYMIFYNRFTGLLRAFLSVNTRGNAYQKANVELYFSNIGYTTGALSTVGYPVALDKADNKSLHSIVNAKNTPGDWFVAEFPINYDPCTCRRYSELIFKISSTQESKLTGTIVSNGTLVAQDIAPPQDKNITLGNISVKDFGKLGKNVMETYNSMDKFKTSMLATHDSKWEKIKIDIQARPNPSTPSLQAIIQTLKVLEPSKSKLDQLVSDSKTSGFLKSGLTALPYIGAAVSLIDFFTGGGQAAGPQEVKLTPMTIKMNSELTGTIVRTDAWSDIVIANPGSEQSSLNAQSPQVIASRKPIYNNTMGIVNLLHTPVVAYRRKSRVIPFSVRQDTWDIPRTTFYGSRWTYNRTVYDYDFKINNWLSMSNIVVNPAHQMTIQDVKGAIVIEGQINDAELLQSGLGSGNLQFDYFDPTEKTYGFRTEYSDFGCLPQMVAKTSDIVKQGTDETLTGPPLLLQDGPYSYSIDRANNNMPYTAWQVDKAGMDDVTKKRVFLKLIINFKRNDDPNAQNVLWVGKFPVDLVERNVGDMPYGFDINYVSIGNTPNPVVEAAWNTSTTGCSRIFGVPFPFDNGIFTMATEGQVDGYCNAPQYLNNTLANGRVSAEIFQDWDNNGGGGGTTTNSDRTESGTASDGGANNPVNEGEQQAFDNNNNNKWLAFNPTGNIVYDFANEDAYAINSYTVTSANDAPDRDPKNWNLQGSNDGSNWTTVDSRNDQNFGGRFETKTFNISNTTAYKQYRLNVTGNNGGGLLQIAEIQMFGPSGTGGGGTGGGGGGTGGGGTGADLTENGTSNDEGVNNPVGEGEAQVFDNQNSTKWLIFNPTGNIAYDFANEDAYAINRYTITSANDDPGRDPKNWNLQGSNDNANWTTVDSQNNQNFGGRFETKTFNISNTTAYKQYRLNVTGNNGSGLLQIGEIQMFGPAGTGGGGTGGGGCSFTDGQFLMDWYGEIIEAKFCNGVLYARATWGAHKGRNWLIGAGMNPTTAACFADYNPGCGALRIAAEGTSSEEIPEKITVFPNPTTGKIKIVFSLQKSENVWLNLYDVQGKSLDLRDFEGKIGRNEMEYDLQNYPSGAYFVNFQSSEKREILKVMKVN